MGRLSATTSTQFRNGKKFVVVAAIVINDGFERFVVIHLVVE